MKMKPKWTSEEFRLKEHHGWRCKPGYKVFVADRGAVRFDIPQTWTIEPGESGSIRFHDKPPPDDDARLEMSILRFPPVDFTDLPPAKLLLNVVDKEDPTELSRSEVNEVTRPDLQLAWIEIKFMDPNERREACNRMCVARCGGLHTLITFVFWADDGQWARPVWKEVLRSLQMGQHYADHNGPVLH